jgi:hypothetical protein
MENQQNDKREQGEPGAPEEKGEQEEKREQEGEQEELYLVVVYSQFETMYNYFLSSEFPFSDEEVALLHHSGQDENDDDAELSNFFHSWFDVCCRWDKWYRNGKFFSSIGGPHVILTGGRKYVKLFMIPEEHDIASHM